MTGDSATEFTAGATRLADEAAVARARARGEMYGFAGLFLSSFIERELQLMEIWRNRSKEERQIPSIRPSPSPSNAHL
jgi:hypothetical protein